MSTDNNSTDFEPEVDPYQIINDLVAENDRLKEELAKLYGIERPFICGEVGEKGVDNMPEYVLVCPMYGADGFAMYKKHKDYSTPGW